MPSAHAANYWPAILEQIERKTTSQQFATWFRSVEAATITDDRVVLAVPNKFHRDWIVTYYREVVEEAVASVLGSPREIHLEVARRSGSAPEPARTSGPSAEPAARATRSENHGEAPLGRPGAASPPSANRSKAPAAAPIGGVRTSGELPLTDGFDYDHFIVGSGNQLAAAAGRSLATDPSVDFSLLLIQGGTGVGKTHLLQAIARAAGGSPGGRPAGSAPRAVAYLRAENFINEFVTACATSAAAASSFRERWRHLDFVCFDDLHLLAGKSGTQGELVHTLNAWCDRGTRVVFGATCPPGEAMNLDPALAARLGGAYRVSLRSPDADGRRALLIAKAKARGETLPEEVLAFLAELPTSNVRELEGALTRVIAGAKLTGVPITLRSARVALADDVLVQRPAASPDRILRAVCQHFEVTTADLCSPRRPQALSFARQTAMFLLRERTELSLSEIGGVLGGRDHTTILHGIRKIEAGATGDSRLRDHLSRLRLLLDR